MPARTFTTVFQTQVDESGSAKLERLASTATASYGRIEAAAAKAAAAANLLGGSGSGGLNITRSLDAQAAAATRLARQNDATSTSTARYAAATRQSSVVVDEAASRNERLAGSLRTVATGLSVVQGPLGPIAGRVRALSDALTQLTGFRLGVAGIGAALFALGSVANTYQQLNTQLRPFFSSQQAANAALADVVGIANRSRLALEPVAQLYVRLTTLQDALPKGTNIGGLTETISKASTLSGGSAENQAQGIVQLVQGLGRGILNGQDLRALEEDSFNLAKTIADGLKVNVGQLKQLGAEGKLTTDVIVGALEREQFVVAARFQTLPKTISSASQEFKNALVSYVGGLDQSVGFTNGLANALSGVAEHLRQIVPLAVGLGAALTAPRAGALFGGAFDALASKITGVVTSLSTISGSSAAFKSGSAGAFGPFRPDVISQPGNQALYEARSAQVAAASRVAQLTETRAVAAEEARLAAEEKATIDGQIAKRAQLSAADRENAASAIAAAEARVDAARLAGAAEDSEAARAASNVASNARARELAARSALQDALNAQTGAQGRVATATENLASAGSDPSLTRSANRKQLEVATRQLEVAEAELAVTDAAVADAQEKAAAAESDRIAARQRLNAVLSEGIAPTTDLAAAEEDLTAAYAQSQAVIQGQTAAIAENVALKNESTAAGLRVTATERGLAAADEALTVGNQALAASQEAVSVAAGAATGGLAALGNKLLAGVGLIFNWQTAILVGVTALVAYASSMSAVDDALGLLNAKQREAIGGTEDYTDKLLKLGEAGFAAAKGIAAANVAQAENDVKSAKNAVASGVEGRTFNTVAGFTNQGALRDLAAQIRASNDPTEIAKLVEAADKIAPVAQRAKSNIGDSLLGLTGATSSQRTSAALTDLQTATAALGQLQKAQADLPAQFAASQKPLGPPPVTRTRQEIDADAALQATGGTKAVQEEALFRANKLKLAEMLKDDGGAEGTGTKEYTAEQSKAYQDALAAEITRHNTVVANLKDETRQTHEAATANRQDQLGAIEDQRLDALISLAQKRKSLTQDEYDAQKEAINSTYDREKAQISDTLSKSHLGRQQLLADIEAQNKAFDKQQTAADAFTARYGPTQRPQAQYELARAKLAAGRDSDITDTDRALAAGVDPVTKSLQDYRQQIVDANTVTDLQAQGWTAVATAVGKALEIQRSTGDVNKDQLNTLVAESVEQERQNTLLQARATITANTRALVDKEQSALTDLLNNLSPKGLGDFFTASIANLKSTIAENLSESIFAPIKNSVAAAFGGDSLQSAQKKAQDAFTAAVGKQATDVTSLSTNFQALGTSVQNLTATINDSAGSLPGGRGDSGIAAALGGSNFVDDGSPLLTNVAKTADALSKSLDASRGPDGLFAQNDEITVTGKRRGVGSGVPGSTPGPTDTLNIIGPGLFKSVEAGISKVGSLFGKPGVAVADTLNKGLDGLGKHFGDLVKGAGIGIAAGQVLGLGGGTGGKVGGALGGAIGEVAGKSLGKAAGDITSKLGGALGTTLGPALGQALPVLGPILGGIAGNLLGSLFSKIPHGASTITQSSNGALSASAGFGNSKSAEAAAVGEANSVITGIQQVAQTLGAQISGSPNITVGTYKGKYRVNTVGTQLGGSSSPVAGLTDFGSDQAAAIQYAIVASIQNGVIKGISQASINILKAGGDLNTSLQKALTIENIPKQLLALTNPVKSAVQTLNDSFATVIADLKEGGATAEQYAQASQLYDLQRAQAIQTAAQTAFGTIEDYLKQITGGTDSPFNKQTTYNNAKAVFSGLQATIDAGGTVDPSKLQTAADNFKSASSALYGGSSDFFGDFNLIVTELQKATAQANDAVATDSGDLPASPFADSSIQALIKGQNDAITSASATNANSIVSAIQSLQDTITAAGGVTASTASAISLLAGSR